jgi:hypothetical protein
VILGPLGARTLGLEVVLVVVLVVVLEVVLETSGVVVVVLDPVVVPEPGRVDVVDPP